MGLIVQSSSVVCLTPHGSWVVGLVLGSRWGGAVGRGVECNNRTGTFAETEWTKVCQLDDAMMR